MTIPVTTSMSGFEFTEEEQKALLYIKDVKDQSDSRTPENFQITFNNNNLNLSVIRGIHTYGYSEGLFEIGIIDNTTDEFCPDLFDIGDKNGDDVLGYCNKEKILHYIEKLGKISTYPLPKLPKLLTTTTKPKRKKRK